MGEIWRVVPSSPQFLASSEGRIMVAPYVAHMPLGGLRQYGGQPHFGVWNKQDGRFITVHKGKTYKVHQLICEAFHGSQPSWSDVCLHDDENAANNCPDNLSWGTQKQNLNAGGYKSALSARLRKIEPEQARAIQLRWEHGEKQAALADEFGVCHQTISEICRGKRFCDQKEKING